MAFPLNHSSWLPIAMLLVLLALPSPSFSASLPTPFTFAYQEYCRSIMPASTEQYSFSPPSSGLLNSSMRHLSLRQGSFHGGSPIFDAPRAFFLDNGGRIRLSIASKFQRVMLHENQAKGYDVVDGSITLQDYRRSWGGQVEGVWIAHSGDLCLAGCFHNPLQAENQVDCQVKIIFRYPAKPSITQPVVKGTLESQRNRSDPLFFKPITVLAVSNEPYVFSKTEHLRAMCALQDRDVPAHIDVLEDESAACRLLPLLTQDLHIVWQPQCTDPNCNVSGGNNRGYPGQLQLGQKIACQNGLVHGYFALPNSRNGIIDETSDGLLAIEGQWDSTRGQLCMSACHFNEAFGDSLTLGPPDCGIVVTLQFPRSIELMFRYDVVGHVKRSQKSASSSIYPFSFRGTFGDVLLERSALPEMRYAYTSAVRRQALNNCEADSAGKEEESKKKSPQFRYPDGTVLFDLLFSVSLNGSSAFFRPLSIDDRIEYFGGEITPGLLLWDDHINVSFTVQAFSPKLVSAEGVYNRRTGLLCLIACRIVEFSAEDAQYAHHFEDDTDKDCQVHATIQYPPTNPSFFGQHGIRGRIISLREHTDPHYFAPITLSSDLKVYRQQAFDNVHQISSEIVIGFISLTMAAVFVAAQRLHAKRCPSILPHVSMLMLVVLTTGYFILLVSNFDAIIPQRTMGRVFPLGEGLQLSEMLVRIMATAVCLLLLRLVHLPWASKGALSTTEGPWHMERKVLYVCLPAYAIGGVIAWIVRANKRKTLLGAMKAYIGFTVDFFLFPQVVANCVWGVEDRVLSPSFYFGMTLLRSFPHLYDRLRESRFVPRLSYSYFYANPAWDYYSRVWDAIIPCGALLLAVLVFFQQRYGASVILPRCWRKKTIYEKISIPAF